MVEGTGGEGLRGGGWAVGGGIFAKTTKTPPLQSGVGGEDIKTSAPNKTTRHAASLSSLHAALVRASTRYARHRPYQERNSNLAN